MKIKNLSKFVRSLIVIIGIVIFMSLITSKTLSHADVEYKTICVDRGDTLWSIASMEAQTNSYYKNKDIRYIINDIMEVNSLNSKTLSVNQELQIPTM